MSPASKAWGHSQQLVFAVPRTLAWWAALGPAHPPALTAKPTSLAELPCWRAPTHVHTCTCTWIQRSTAHAPWLGGRPSGRLAFSAILREKKLSLSAAEACTVGR